jgi:hypothetical protein
MTGRAVYRSLARTEARMRKIAGEAEARRALEAVRVSGKGLGEWARSNGIDGRSLHAWNLAFSRRGTKAGRLGLVELVPAPEVGIAVRYAIRVGEVAFEFGDDAREETLRRVLGVLRSC